MGRRPQCGGRYRLRHRPRRRSQPCARCPRSCRGDTVAGRTGGARRVDRTGNETDRFMNRFARLALVVLLAGTVTGEALAQERGGAGRRGEGDAPALTPVEVLNMLDAYALVQAQNALDLKDEQYGEFVTRLKRLQQTRRRSQQARNGLLMELRRLTNPTV